MGNIGFREHTNPVFHKFKCFKTRRLDQFKKPKCYIQGKWKRASTKCSIIIY